MADMDKVIRSLPEDIEKAGHANPAATSVLQQRAQEVRAQRINWQSYLQSQMISQEDFSVISRLDSGDPNSRKKVVKEAAQQCAKTLYNLLGHISKDQTVQYLLTLVDDFLQEDKSRVTIFREYSKKRKESVWAAFLNLLKALFGI